MATNTAGSVARFYNKQLVHYLRADFNVTDVDVSGGVTKTLGTIPAGSVILKPISGVAIHVAFDDTTVVDLGPSDNNDLWATDIVTTTIGFVALDETVTNKVYVDTTVQCSFIPAGTSVTVGAASAVICYIPPTEGALTWLGAQS
jgi:hypothetical protein